MDRSIPGLDGLRAGSILLVLASHIRWSAGFPGYPGWFWHLGDLGNLGVRVFFVISGFLITHLLLREEERNGRISIKRFYIRRAFRILPPLWVFLIVMLVARSVGLVTFPLIQWLQGATFTENYEIAGGWNLGHLWSLSVEEQFYLLWPAILMFAPRVYRTRILAAGFLAAPAIRLGIVWYQSANGITVLGDPPNGFFSSMDALAIGCMLAVLRHSPVKSRVLRWLPTGLWAAALPVLLLVLNGLPGNRWFSLGLKLPLLNLAAVCLVNAATCGTVAGWQPLLDSGVMRWLGRLSYSLYLWQQPLFHRDSSAWFMRFPINLLPALSLAAASYYLVERPALALRPGSADRNKPAAPSAAPM